MAPMGVRRRRSWLPRNVARRLVSISEFRQAGFPRAGGSNPTPREVATNAGQADAKRLISPPAQPLATLSVRWRMTGAGTRADSPRRREWPFRPDEGNRSSLSRRGKSRATDGGCIGPRNGARLWAKTQPQPPRASSPLRLVRRTQPRSALVSSPIPFLGRLTLECALRHDQSLLPPAATDAEPADARRLISPPAQPLATLSARWWVTGAYARADSTRRR